MSARTAQGGLLFADRATDVRNLYVAMSRGWEINEAFFGVAGEETAVDVFIQCMSTDWIDQPATVRHAELNETTLHRPGLLDGPVLREMMEQRHQILTDLEDAERISKQIPAERRRAEQQIADVRQTIAKAEAEYRRAESVLENYDRPMRRRKHEADIEAANRDLQRQPEIARNAEHKIEEAGTTLAHLAVREAEVTRILNGRTQATAVVVADIDDRLTHDLRVRTRIARLEQPSAIVETLGRRLGAGREAATWDRAAGRLHRHQAAFDIADGIGEWPGWLDRSTYVTSCTAVECLMTELRPSGPDRRLQLPSIELGV